MVYNEFTKLSQYRWLEKNKEYLQTYRDSRKQITKDNFNMWYNSNIEKEKLRGKMNSKKNYEKKKMLKQTLSLSLSTVSI